MYIDYGGVLFESLGLVLLAAWMAWHSTNQTTKRGQPHLVSQQAPKNSFTGKCLLYGDFDRTTAGWWMLLLASWTSGVVVDVLSFAMHESR